MARVFVLVTCRLHACASLRVMGLCISALAVVEGSFLSRIERLAWLFTGTCGLDARIRRRPLVTVAMAIAPTVTAAIASTVAPAITTPAAAIALEFAFGTRVRLGVSFSLRGGFFVDQRLPVGNRNLIVVGVNFVEGQEAVAIAAIFDEGRLQGRFDAGDLCQINIAAQQFSGGRLVVEFFYPAIAKHHDPGLFRVGGIDKHLVGFVIHWNCVLGSEIRARDPAIGVS